MNQTNYSPPSKDAVVRALVVAVVIGSALTLNNQWQAIFGSEQMAWLPFALVFITPFLVVLASQILATKQVRQDQTDNSVSFSDGGSFFETALAHGIPRRALLLGLIMGLFNTVFLIGTAVSQSGSIGPLPILQLTQAFALPVVFSLLSQTVTYRRLALAR